MTQKEKELLLQDLCARLPFNVLVECSINSKESIDLFLTTSHIDELINDSLIIKPYLRPLSSMTEEEKEEIAFIRDRDFQSVRKWFRNESIKETGNICPITYGEIDYCNKKHLDYRGLIPMGLALEASKDMYNFIGK